MIMKFKFIVFTLLCTCLLVTAQTSNRKQIALEGAVQRIVQLSQFISTLQADQAESIANDAAYDETDSFQVQLSRINELMDVRDTTSQLLNRISSTAPTAVSSIIESMARVEIAYAIGEEIFYGEPLNDVLSGIEAIDVLPDLLSSSSDDIKIMVEEMDVVPTGIDSELAGTESIEGGEVKVPNIYDPIGQPTIYRNVMETLHDDFRESITDPSGGGFGENDHDATPI